VNLTTNYWILGDEYKHVFSVEISRNKSVYALKKATKANNPNTLKDTDACTLILYDVSIPYSPQLTELAAALELDELKLNALDTLSEAFANGLVPKYVNVVVEVLQASGA
jgi:Crinkler effector protein N-terminal domain